MKFKVPKKVKIGGFWYTIKYPYNFKEDDDVLGQIDYKKLLIKLSNKLISAAPEKLEVVFLHEVVHGINFHYNNSQVNENDITQIAEGLYQVLKDNNIVEDANAKRTRKKTKAGSKKKRFKGCKS